MNTGITSSLKLMAGCNLVCETCTGSFSVWPANVTNSSVLPSARGAIAKPWLTVWFLASFSEGTGAEAVSRMRARRASATRALASVVTSLVVPSEYCAWMTMGCWDAAPLSSMTEGKHLRSVRVRRDCPLSHEVSNRTTIEAKTPNTKYQTPEKFQIPTFNREALNS